MQGNALYFKVLHGGFGQHFEIDKMQFEERTENWQLSLFENRRLGQIMALNGAIQTSEWDGFVYHGMLTPVPLLAHGRCSEHEIISDCTDPAGPTEVLFSSDCYAHCKRCWHDVGFLVAQNGVPNMQPGTVQDTGRRVSSDTKDCWFFTATAPTFTGGSMAFT